LIHPWIYTLTVKFQHQGKEGSPDDWRSHGFMHSGASTPRQEEVTQLYVFLLSYIPCHTSILHPPPTYQN